MKAYVETMEEYRVLYERSVRDPEGFLELNWRIIWIGIRSGIKCWSMIFNKPEINWFKGGKLNASYNCLDRHLTPGEAIRLL